MKDFTQHTLETLFDSIIESTRLDLTYSIQENPGSTPDLSAVFSGPDTPYLTADHAEVLRAIEHLAFELLGRQPGEHRLISINSLSSEHLSRSAAEYGWMCDQPRN